MGNGSAGYVRLRCEGCSLFFLARADSEEELCMFCRERPLITPEMVRKARRKEAKQAYYEANRERRLAEERAKRRENSRVRSKRYYEGHREQVKEKERRSREAARRKKARKAVDSGQLSVVSVQCQEVQAG